MRPIMAILVAPEVAKAWVMRGPIPEPPPVMRITFPAADNSGREGEMAGYVDVWKTLVYLGNAI